MVNFGERIRALAEAIKKDEKDVADDLGLSKSRLSHYISGRSNVPSELLQKIVDTYNINPLFLFREDASLYEVKEKLAPYVVSNEYKYYPHSISAGLPFVADGTTELNTVTIPDELMGKYAGHGDIIISKINGDSMDRLMNDGSFIAIKPITLPELKNGDIVVFSDEHEYSVKYFYKHDDKLIFKPYSHNNCHHEQHYNEHDNIQIHGKVVTYIVNLD